MKKIRKRNKALFSEKEREMISELCSRLDTDRGTVLRAGVRALHKQLEPQKLGYDQRTAVDEPVPPVGHEPEKIVPLRGRRPVQTREPTPPAPRSRPVHSGPLDGVKNAREVATHPCRFIRDYYLKPLTPGDCEGTCTNPGSFGKPCFWPGPSALGCPEYEARIEVLRQTTS